MAHTGCHFATFVILYMENNSGEYIKNTNAINVR